MIVSADFLLQGAFCAMEQAGRLLNDSAELYSKGRYSSSLVLSAFCREEMGRTRIIFGE